MEEGIKKTYNEDYDYILFDDGYVILPKKGSSKITQRGRYGKVMDSSLSYEENCILQIEDMIKGQEHQDDENKLRADLDYMAVMMDVDLPSEEEEV